MRILKKQAIGIRSGIGLAILFHIGILNCLMLLAHKGIKENEAGVTVQIVGLVNPGKPQRFAVMNEVKSEENKIAEERTGHGSEDQVPPAQPGTEIPSQPAGLEEPETLTPVLPVYPEEARRLGIEGRVSMLVSIDEQGFVRNIEIIRSPHEILSRAAIKSMLSVRFKPAMANGQPKAADVRFSLQFKLE
jgi:TonB family protein